jgi:tRNA modification GTPase
MPPADDLIRVAILTPPGRGALAVVGLVGAHAVDLGDALFRPLSGPPLAGRSDAAICVGRWSSSATSHGEDVVVVRHGAAHLEVQCHGGLAASAAILQSLVCHGAVAVPWWDFQAAQGDDEIAIEARRAMPLAAGPKAARILVRQLAGAFAREVRSLAAQAGAVDSGPRLARLLRAARVGLRLTTPWRVAFTGRVNAGKSSLINVLAGHGRMLVSPHPGTTRDLVETRVVLEGWEIDLIDTAGTRDAFLKVGPVERAGIDRGRTAAATADLVIEVTAADDAPAATSRGPAGGPPRLRVLSKADLVGEHRPSGDEDMTSSHAGLLLTSAHSGVGIDSLAARIIELLVPEETTEPDLLAGAVPFTLRQVDLIKRLLPPDHQTVHAPAV